MVCFVGLEFARVSGTSIRYFVARVDHVTPPTQAQYLCTVVDFVLSRLPSTPATTKYYNSVKRTIYK